MSIQRYFKRKDGLPDPKGSLARAIPSHAIASANLEVRNISRQENPKRGPYKRYTNHVYMWLCSLGFIDTAPKIDYV